MIYAGRAWVQARRVAVIYARLVGWGQSTPVTMSPDHDPAYVLLPAGVERAGGDTKKPHRQKTPVGLVVLQIHGPG